MKSFKIEDQVFAIFPELELAVLSFTGVDNREEGRGKILKEVCISFYGEIKDLDGLHPYVEEYKEAMKQIKKKKGSLASIEAMAKRIKRGDEIHSINPVVDLYNSVCLASMFTCGGEDLDQIKGDMVLGFATGEEAFVPLGEEENSPPREGELIYRDDAGAVVRSWLWREADRTKITNRSQNILLYMELVNPLRREEFYIAAERLFTLIQDELGGCGTKSFLSKDTPQCQL